jgi:hypothetical protein
MDKSPLMQQTIGQAILLEAFKAVNATLRRQSTYEGI